MRAFPCPTVHGVSVLGVAVGVMAVSALFASVVLTEVGERLSRVSR